MSDEPRDRPPDEPSSEDARKAARPYTIVVGVLFLAFAVFAGVNALSNRPTSGLGGIETGKPLPRFAAPTATGGVEKDANVTQNNGGSSGHTPACQVPGPRSEVVRICDYFDRPLVLVAWFRRGCGTCARQLDTVERVRKLFPRVAFIGLDVRSSLEDAKKDVLKHGWHFPMAVDRDGAVAGLYRVVVGPETLFAYPGGTAMSNAYGELDQAKLIARVRRLIAASSRRGLLR